MRPFGDPKTLEKRPLKAVALFKRDLLPGEPASATKRRSAGGSRPSVPGYKNAWRLKASLVFLDKSGRLMAPLVRRTRAPMGVTPVPYQRGRSHERVSMIAALTVSPLRRRVGLYFSLLPDENVVTENRLPFVPALRRHLGSAFVLVWDRLNVHRSAAPELRPHSPSIRAVFLPPYAPELNPVEPFRSYLKINPLANHAADDVDELACRAERHSRQIANDEAVLRSFLRTTPLVLRLR